MRFAENQQFQLLGFVSNIIMKGCQLRETVYRSKRFVIKKHRLICGRMAKKRKWQELTDAKVPHTKQSGRWSVCYYPVSTGIFSAVATRPSVVFDRQGNNYTFPYRTPTVTAFLATFSFRSIRGRRNILLPDPAARIGYIVNIDFHSFYLLQKFMPTHGK
jgi:hypothetical protein